MPKDYAYLASLSDAQLLRLEWCASRPPKSRSRDQILQDPVFLELWDRTRALDAAVKIFPPYRLHKNACGKLGIRPDPKFTKGIPPSIVREPLLFHAPPSVKTTYERLYNLSRYDPQWNMRKCEISSGLLCKLTGYSHATIERAMSFLRAHRYILRIWRGRPHPRNERYQHSCYDLPYDLDYVMAWRIHRGRSPPNNPPSHNRGTSGTSITLLTKLRLKPTRQEVGTEQCSVPTGPVRKSEIRISKSETNSNDQNPNAQNQEAFDQSDLSFGLF